MYAPTHKLFVNPCCILNPERLSEKKNTTKFIELPLEDLKQMFTSEVQQKFLAEQVVAKQKGVAHPQDKH